MIRFRAFAESYSDAANLIIARIGPIPRLYITQRLATKGEPNGELMGESISHCIMTYEEDCRGILSGTDSMAEFLAHRFPDAGRVRLESYMVLARSSVF